MAIPLRVLIIDDSQDDTFMLLRALTHGGFDPTWQRVDTQAALVDVLKEKDWDIILSDFSMPHFNGLEALRVIRTGNYEGPVILVSGAIGEEIAVEAIKAGAQDYVLKDNLTRLVSAVERALREVQNSQARLTAEAALQESQARLLAETRQRLQELDALNRISAILRLADTTAGILPGFLDEALSTLNSPHGAVMLFYANTSQLFVALARGKMAVFQGTQLPLDLELQKLLEDESAVYVTADCQANDTMFEIQYPDTIGPLMAIPLRSSEAVLGLLVIARDRHEVPPIFTDSDRRLALTITELGGNALQRARLFEQTHQRVQRLSVLHAIDMAVSSSLSIAITINLILDQIVSQLNIDAADVLIFNQQAHWLEYAAGRGFRSDKVKRTRFRLGQSFPGSAVLERKPVTVMDLSADSQFIQLHALEAERFTSYFAVPLVAKGQVKGVLELFHREPILADPELRDYFESLAAQTAIAMDNSEMFEGLKRSNLELLRAYDAVIESWARSLEVRERTSHFQAQNIAEMTLRLGIEMGMPEEELPHLRRGALLHDIGLIGVPEEILYKKGPLTPDERQVIAQHPGQAHELLAGIQFLAPALDIPIYHHERWDGGGYPNGMKGEQIPLAARVFAVVDVWNALTSERIYREAWTPGQASDYLRQQAGMQFDPVVVNKFLELLPQLERRFGSS